LTVTYPTILGVGRKPLLFFGSIALTLILGTLTVVIFSFKRDSDEISGKIPFLYGALAIPFLIVFGLSYGPVA